MAEQLTVGLKKLAVQCLNKAFCFVSTSRLADSFVLRNRQLLKPTKRCVQLKTTSYFKIYKHEIFLDNFYCTSFDN
jgi:hypothetical protein